MHPSGGNSILIFSETLVECYEHLEFRIISTVFACQCIPLLDVCIDSFGISVIGDFADRKLLVVLPDVALYAVLAGQDAARSTIIARVSLDPFVGCIIKKIQRRKR